MGVVSPQRGLAVEELTQQKLPSDRLFSRLRLCNREGNPMEADLTQQRQAVIQDLKALICELEKNPEVSPWVVNLTLRSVREKVAVWGQTSAQQRTYLEYLLNLESERRD